MKIRILLLATALTLSACSDSAKEEDAFKESTSAEALYMEGRDAMLAGDTQDAIDAFQEVERQYPFSPLATRAKVMAAYAAYRAHEYDEAVDILDRFVRMHPGDGSVPYAYYIRALSYYEQISDVKRDQFITEQALQALTTVVRRFPDTEYARDAKLKLDLTYDHLAGKEMTIGRYYLEKDEYLAAINRFRYVVENYQTTSHVPEALHRLVEGYLRLGITEEAKRYAAVLGHNYPASPWYKDSYGLLTDKGVAVEEGWLDNVVPEL